MKGENTAEQLADAKKYTREAKRGLVIVNGVDVAAVLLAALEASETQLAAAQEDARKSKDAFALADAFNGKVDEIARLQAEVSDLKTQLAKACWCQTDAANYGECGMHKNMVRDLRLENARLRGEVESYKKNIPRCLCADEHEAIGYYRGGLEECPLCREKSHAKFLAREMERLQGLVDGSMPAMSKETWDALEARAEKAEAEAKKWEGFADADFKLREEFKAKAESLERELAEQRAVTEHLRAWAKKMSEKLCECGHTKGQHPVSSFGGKCLKCECQKHTPSGWKDFVEGVNRQQQSLIAERDELKEKVSDLTVENSKQDESIHHLEHERDTLAKEVESHKAHWELAEEQMGLLQSEVSRLKAELEVEKKRKDAAVDLIGQGSLGKIASLESALAQTQSMFDAATKAHAINEQALMDLMDPLGLTTKQINELMARRDEWPGELVGMVKGALARKDEALRRGHQMIVENDRDPELNWLDDLRAILYGGLTPTPKPSSDSGGEEGLKDEDVQWVVNDLSELGVKIRDEFFFLYKGHSYKGGSKWRPVFKREFGECCHPWGSLARRQDVSVDKAKTVDNYVGYLGEDESDWKDLPSASKEEKAGEDKL